jgi:hypothetical protein
MDPLHTLALTVAGAWIGAIGIGLIKIGLKLNNTVQRLTVLVDSLAADAARQKRDIRALSGTTATHAERLAIPESRHS